MIVPLNCCFHCPVCFQPPLMRNTRWPSWCSQFCRLQTLLCKTKQNGVHFEPSRGNLLPPAYVVRGKVMFWHASVLPSIHLSVHGGGVPISHNALQHFPECHEAAGGGVPRSGYPPGGYQGPGTPPGGGVPRSGYPPGGYWGPGTPPGGYWGPGTPPPRGGTEVRVPPPGGGTEVRVPPTGGGGGTEVRVPPRGGYRGPGTPPGGVPRSGYPPGGGGTRVGQQKEYSLHGGRYASCVHAGGLSCWTWNDMDSTFSQNQLLKLCWFTSSELSGGFCIILLDKK